MERFPILSQSRDICTCYECPNRKSLTRRTILHRLRVTACQVLFMLACAAFSGGNFALRVHAQSTRDINTTDIAVNAAKLVDVTARVAALESHDVGQDQEQNHQASEISVIQGMGIAIPIFLAFLQGLVLLMGRKNP